MSSAPHQSEASTSAFLLNQTPQQNNSKYRAYASSVDKALKSFESTTEWADLIAALGKLGKVFSSNAKQFNDIPNTLTVAKRLSQCLHPALPSGVHLKALETYRQVFLILGRTKNLAKYLFLYASGLFPLMDHCGIKVKSELLAIFEQFILPLGPDLCPALPGFIAAILLALEEGTEFYGKSFQLLEQLIEKVRSDAFYTCFWQAVFGNPSVRLPALIFMNAKIEKRKGPQQMDEQLLVTLSGGQSRVSSQMFKALCAVADDSGSALVQRHLLDILCTTIPLNSDFVSKWDLVQILRRCLFVVLRRDMSLNRRLCQWLLNRDTNSAGVPVNGVDDSTDLTFFKKYTLPLVKLAICDYLLMDTVEILSSCTGTLRYGTKSKDIQIQYPEVRVCRLLHYMLDRPELGQLILEESLMDLLNTSCFRDIDLIRQLIRECESVDCNFEIIWDVNLDRPDDNECKRLDEIKKNLNALLKSLEPNFIWNFLKRIFVRNQEDKSVETISISEFEYISSGATIKNSSKEVFPLIVAFCLKHINLDADGDIRGRHLPNLLQNILDQICISDCDHFSSSFLVTIVIVCRRLLTEITQNNVSTVFESIQENVECSPTKRGAKCNKQLTEEQELVESSLGACLNLYSQVCNWYRRRPEQRKIGVLSCISMLTRDFADFPFFSLQPLVVIESPQSPCRSLSDSLSQSKDREIGLPSWLSSLILTIDPKTWETTAESFDFEIRAQLFDVILYLTVRSGSMIEQHSAVVGRVIRQRNSFENLKNQKTTTTVLLKPFFSQNDLNIIEKEELFKKITLILWKRFTETTEPGTLQSIALLLLRLHSRRPSESSSELEDIIVSELTSSNKITSGEALRKFRDLWSFCRSVQLDEVYSGIPLKSMNRVVMVLLGFIADDSLGTEQVELRALALTWFLDCSRHNDLHKILQILTLMLLNPATARVSIQFVQMRQRITAEQLPLMPSQLNCVSLTTASGKQTFHHVCNDIDINGTNRGAFNIFLPQNDENSANNYNFVTCDPRQTWISELNKQLFLPTNAAFSQLEEAKMITESTLVNGTQTADKTHRRTLSDIPQFDGDGESVDSFSLDISLDQDVVETVQYIVDIVCEMQDGKNSTSGLYECSVWDIAKSLPLLDRSNLSDEVFDKQRGAPGKRDRSVSTAAHDVEDDVSVVGSLAGTTAVAAALPRIASYGGGDTIKRIRTGHRRQDSLQESIFSTGTQELRLFDPTELPYTTCPGDYKQPLLDEISAHMLFYAENSSIVDLGRAEKLFQTITALLKSGNGIGRQIVSCMLLTNMATFVSGNGDKSTLGGASATLSHQLIDFMTRHYRHIQGEGFWIAHHDSAETNEERTTQNQNDNKSNLPKHSTLFEIFTTVLLYFFRSYYLNSPINPVTEKDLVLAWKCKISALNCFTEMLHILDEIVKDAGSKEFATFVQHVYRQTKTQKVVLILMLSAVPTPPTQKNWRIPLTMDIAQFNNGPKQSNYFRDLIYAYHRSLLCFATVLISLEHSLHIGMQHFNSQTISGLPPNFRTHQQITENQINYNSPQNRLTIRESRYSVVELRLFLGVILNALKRCPERHELWLQFFVGILPYLDRALATFVVHAVEQICRNLYESILLNKESLNDGLFPSPDDQISDQLLSILEHPKSPIQFVDYRLKANSNTSSRAVDHSLQKYPANYELILIESLMSILHFCMMDNSSLLQQQFMGVNCVPFYTPLNANHSPSSSLRVSSTNTFSTSNMTSMVGSAISVIPGTGLINNLFGRVFTSGENSMNAANISSRNNNHGKSPEWLDAQRELIKRFPSALAIMMDVWSYAVNKNLVQKAANQSGSVDIYNAICLLILDILNPIAKKHKNTLINSFGIVWMFRSQTECTSNVKSTEAAKFTFLYSTQQTNIAKLALKLKAFSLNSIIVSVSEMLKESVNKTKSMADKASNYSLDVSLLEFLHECTRQLSSNELYDSWSALNILFIESQLYQLPARASFLEFILLVEFVRRCGSQSITEDRYISKAILEVSQKLIDALNAIVGWQLESTTWLKRTLVVRQDAANSKTTSSDLSPMTEQKWVPSSTALSASALASENNSIHGSTMSLSGVAPSRLSLGLDVQSTSTAGPVDIRKPVSSLRSSLKDASGVNKKDPCDSTQALFLLAENLTELIDSVCKNEDKDKLIPALQAVWNNTLPYLKSKSVKNVRSFLASSQLLASMSSFNYMRPVWKKNALELLWDNSFFKMDIHALRQWLIVIDNLMTNDKTSFKELLARVATSSSTTLSTLITSKEQEYEMRSQYLKRLAFVILSSEIDQYTGQLNEIQERLTENLKLCQVPIIYTQVFTCYRVLLIRMSSNNFISIWPSMVTELTQVLAQIEIQLSNTNSTPLDDQKSAKDEQQMQLFLAVSKFLEALCILPAGYFSQFQMCRWAFVSATGNDSLAAVFVPFAVRINHLLNIKYNEFTYNDLETRTPSLFNVKILTSLKELQPLFYVLAKQNNITEGLENGQLDCDHSQEQDKSLDSFSGHLDGSPFNGLMSLKSAVAKIEHSLYVDFAEHWQL